MIDKNRILKQPEYEYSNRSGKLSYYIISADVGRKGCDSVACILKVTPQPSSPALINLVNVETKTDLHFEDQSIWLKKLYYKYKARRLVVDCNGLGIGLLDLLVKPNVDSNTGETLPDFGLYNDNENYYKKYQTDVCEFDAIYSIKAQAPLNTEAHVALQTALTTGKLKLLITERDAKAKLLNTSKGEKMSPEDRAEYLRPFTLTDILREEMLNLRQENDGVNIILKGMTRAIKKDKFSALEYGLYYIKQEEERIKKKKRFNAADWKFFN